MASSYPFSANILSHIFSPKLVTNTSGGYDVKVDLVNVDNVNATGTITGNISATGDGNVTGGVNGVYLGLTDYSSIPPNAGPPVTNYLYSSNSELIYENATQSVNLLGWVSKLAQNTYVRTLPDVSGGTQLNDVIHAYNDLVNLFYRQGLIYTAPSAALSINTQFDVLAASVYTPYTGPYIRNQQLQVMNMNNSLWPSNLTLITQIQSVVINVYSGINKGTGYISDARVILTSTESTPAVFYAYGRRITPQASDDFAVGITNTITDRNLLQLMFSTIGSPSDTIDTTRDINAYWYCGYEGNQIKNCQILSFVINYSHL